MKRLLVWDLPVRLFHVLLAVSFIAAFAIAQVVDDDSALFSAHMLLGLFMAHLVLLRLIWGFLGTRHARFRDFLFGPRAVLTYLRDAVRGRAKRHAGHNPGTAVAAFAIFALVLGLAVTGVLMGQGHKDAEGVHEVFAYALLVTVIAHLVGVALHTYHQRENITRSMIDGKREVDPAEAIPTARPAVGLAFLALVAIVGWHLASSFDPVTRKLDVPIFGAPLQLGEVEDEHGQRGSVHHNDDEHEDDDD